MKAVKRYFVVVLVVFKCFASYNFVILNTTTIAGY